jgi:WD40 repeat protein
MGEKLTAILDGETGKVLHTLRIGAIASAAIIDDGRVVLAGEDGVLRVWRAEGGKAEIEVKASKGPLVSVAVSHSGRVLVTADGEGLIRLWDVATGKALGERRGHVGPVFRLAFLPDGRLFSSGTDHTVRIWRGP